METLEQKARLLISGLSAEAQEKQALLNQLNAEGVTPLLLEAIGDLIDQAEEKLLSNAKKQAADFNKEFENLKKQAQKEQDEKNLEDIRNKIKQN